MRLKRLARSTRVTMAERPLAPMMRSPSKCPTLVRALAASQRRWIRLNVPSGLDFYSGLSRPTATRRRRPRLAWAYTLR